MLGGTGVSTHPDSDRPHNAQCYVMVSVRFHEGHTSQCNVMDLLYGNQDITILGKHAAQALLHIPIYTQKKAPCINMATGLMERVDGLQLETRGSDHGPYKNKKETKDLPQAQTNIKTQTKAR